MLAIEMSEFGTPTVLKTRRVDTPVLTPSQVLVQNHAVAIDPFDVKFVAGLMGDKSLPLIPGSSVVGEIVAVGAKVTDFAVGDRVAATRYLKSYAEFVPVHQKNLAKVPEQVSDELAVTAVLGAATGFEMITRTLDVQPQQNILITGAVGAVGQAAVQAALNRHANVFALIRHNQVDRLAPLGNVTPIYAEAIPEISFDGVLNTISDDPTLALLIKHLTPNGQLISLTGIPTDFKHDDRITEVFSSGAGDILTELLTALANDQMQLSIADVKPFNEKNLQEAHRIMLEDHPQGKLVLTF